MAMNRVSGQLPMVAHTVHTASVPQAWTWRMLSRFEPSNCLVYKEVNTHGVDRVLAALQTTSSRWRRLQSEPGVQQIGF